MENSEKLLFEDETHPHWYIALAERWIGPLSADDVYERILSGELTWAHFAWKTGQKEWRRLCDIETFQAAVPRPPQDDIEAEVNAASKLTVRQASAGRSQKNTPPETQTVRPPERSWFLYYNDTQFGPFSQDEVCNFLRVGKIHGKVHTWRDGMDGWERLEQIPIFAADVAEAAKVRARKRAPVPPPFSETMERKTVKEEPSVREQRSAPRKPLVARLIMASGNEVVVAVCRDISVGGMQVLTDKIPGLAGTHLKMNVSPSCVQSRVQDRDQRRDQKGGNIKPFVAEGVIVRLLEDGRGFSFRFERLPDDARQAIEEYIRLSTAS